MANFKYKIISKILADRLAQLMPKIISKEQKGFIQNRDIRDCFCIASEAANLLHNKSYRGNIMLKIDIAKAFDTLEWSFLIHVLRAYGFNETFCNWIQVILKSVYLSISINGKAQGYFNCTRGVRQGDPLSPLLFCLAEDVLSRGISKLVNVEKLELIKGTRHWQYPISSFIFPVPFFHFNNSLRPFFLLLHRTPPTFLSNLHQSSLKHQQNQHAITSFQSLCDVMSITKFETFSSLNLSLGRALLSNCARIFKLAFVWLKTELEMKLG